MLRPSSRHAPTKSNHDTKVTADTQENIEETRLIVQSAAESAQLNVGEPSAESGTDGNEASAVHDGEIMNITPPWDSNQDEVSP